MVTECGWGPSDCQKVFGVAASRAASPHPGLEVESVILDSGVRSLRVADGGSFSGSSGVNFKSSQDCQFVL